MGSFFPFLQQPLRNPATIQQIIASKIPVLKSITPKIAAKKNKTPKIPIKKTFVFLSLPMIFFWIFVNLYTLNQATNSLIT